jgi:hypothetical protein
VKNDKTIVVGIVHSKNSSGFQPVQKPIANRSKPKEARMDQVVMNPNGYNMIFIASITTRDLRKTLTQSVHAGTSASLVLV